MSSFPKWCSSITVIVIVFVVVKHVLIFADLKHDTAVVCNNLFVALSYWWLPVVIWIVKIWTVITNHNSNPYTNPKPNTNPSPNTNLNPNPCPNPNPILTVQISPGNCTVQILTVQISLLIYACQQAYRNGQCKSLSQWKNWYDNTVANLRTWKNCT